MQVDIAAPYIPSDPAMPIMLGKLTKDIKQATATLSPKEARFLVDLYYQWQDERIRQANQVRALTTSGEPHEAVAWVLGQSEVLERNVRAMLDAYTQYEPTGMGRWAREIVGIGPVIAAGLASNVDITRCPTAGHLWAFAGLDPTREWTKGEKRPWNASLKRLAFLIGESFVKVQNNERDVYGKLFVQRKAYEQRRNDAGELADQAKAKLARFKIGEDTDARKHYESGKLPPAHIHARARRWTVKLFLAHYFEEAYTRHHGAPPPLPYPIAHLGHAHKIDRPQ